ncbi:single-stranded-DNA-specific exonuclease RecJ [Rhizobium laguerreae]|nr:single-stranded-DNA-specific exonuclease RecJ [Rhizobium laguerreae]
MTAIPEFCNDVSVRGREWQLKPQPDGPTIAGVHPSAVSVAVARGFDPERFFSPKLRDELPDPSIMKGMDEAVAIFCNAVEARKRIAIYGDYDVDGATSTSLLVRWLTWIGQPPIFYIPDRIAEGYGPNANAIRRLKEEHDIEFILFLDCGTRAHAPLAVGVELGIEMAILDHHDPDANDPPAVLVNPKRRDETGDYAYLCAAGLAFVFLVALNREMRNRGFFTEDRPEPDLKKWLGIVALGTVCDMVPLVKLNRVFVKMGLPLMGEIPGIRALQSVNATKNGLPDFNEHTCGFVFGPCINAEGRIGDTRSGATLLAADDETVAMEMAVKLVETNKERQDITKAAESLAIEIATTQMAGDSTIVIYNDDWHPGIVGIVAGRVKDAVNKPAVVIGRGGTGSCRSVTGYSIGAAVDVALEAGVIDKGGGHMMAAGLHVKPENVGELRRILCEQSNGFKMQPVEVDMSIACGGLTVPLVEGMEVLRPFGMGNPQPRIVVHGGYVTRVQIMTGVHIKLHLAGRFGSCKALLFNGVGTPLGDALALAEDKFVDVYGRSRIDFHAGKNNAVILIDDAMIRPESAEESA